MRGRSYVYFCWENSEFFSISVIMMKTFCVKSFFSRSRQIPVQVLSLPKVSLLMFYSWRGFGAEIWYLLKVTERKPRATHWQKSTVKVKKSDKAEGERKINSVFCRTRHKTFGFNT